MNFKKRPCAEILWSFMIFLMVYMVAVLATKDCFEEEASTTRGEHIDGQRQKFNHSHEDGPEKQLHNNHSSNTTKSPVNYSRIPANVYKVKVTGYNMITSRVLQLTFTRLDGLPFRFAAGQFVQLLFLHDGKFIRRSYSLANSPDQYEMIEVAVSITEKGFATKILFDLKIGDELFALGPLGDTLLLRDTKYISHLVLVATGTGVAPYRSMLPAIAERLHHERNLHVTVLLGVRQADELLYAEDFIAFDKKHERFHFRGCLSRAQELIPPYQYSGYVQSAFEKLRLNPRTDLVYLCGKSVMVNDCVQTLMKMGFTPQRVIKEKYVTRAGA